MKLKLLLLLGLALLAAHLGRKAAKANAELIQALWAVVGMVALTGTANTPKTRNVEDRLNALVPVIFPNTGGTISGPVTVNGNHTVNGTLYGTALHVNGTGSATFEVNGNGHITSGMTVDGNHVVGGSVSAGGQVLVGGASSSATFAVNGNGHVTAGFQVDGQLVTASGSGMPVAAPSYPGSPSSSYNAAWAASVTNILTNVINDLKTAGVFN